MAVCIMDIVIGLVYVPGTGGSFDAENTFNSSPRGQNGRHFAEDIFNAFLSMNIFVFWLKFHWNLYLRAHLTKTQHWVR